MQLIMAIRQAVACGFAMISLLYSTTPIASSEVAAAGEHIATIETVLNSCEIPTHYHLPTFFVDKGYVLDFSYEFQRQAISRTRIPLLEVQIPEGEQVSLILYCYEPGCIRISIESTTQFLKPSVIRRSNFLFPFCERKDFLNRAINAMRQLQVMNK